MNQQGSYRRPATPAPGVPVPELRIATLRPSARHLAWSALLLIVVAGACGYLYGNLPAPFQDWMLLSAGAAVVVLGAVLPWLRWLAHRYTITTRRVIEQTGWLGSTRRELMHLRGYTVTVRRGLHQRLARVGTVSLDDGAGGRMVLRSIPDSDLVHEVLVDQVEVNQILAHRDAQPPPPLP